MGAGSAIEWTDHTFNPWEGCQKVGPGCDNCYAEARNARFGTPKGEPPVAMNWGPGAPRRRTSPANWRKPLQWQADAARFHAEHGRRQRVFCASLADVFDNAVPHAWRVALFDLIERTPDLDWLLLTKRIGNVATLTDVEWGDKDWPANVWLGATVVNQAEVDRDVPRLLATVGPRVRFLSMEPLLGPVQFDPCDLARLDWIIVGGESGPDARPIHPAWARDLREQCAVAAGVPFLFKQWGEWVPVCAIDDNEVPDEQLYRPRLARHRPEGPRRCRVAQLVMQASGRTFPVDEWSRVHGENPSERDWAYAAGSDAMLFLAIGKARAGRQLDGVQHDGVPA